MADQTFRGRLIAASVASDEVRVSIEEDDGTIVQVVAAVTSAIEFVAPDGRVTKIAELRDSGG